MASLSAPFWEPFGVIFHVFSRSIFGLIFDGIFYRFWSRFGVTLCVGSGRNSLLFRSCSAGGIFEGPLAHFGLPLPPFGLSSAPFSPPLAPFWLPFGALGLPVRSLLAPFGLLWHPFGSVVLLLAPTRANRFRKICFWAPETASQPQTPVGILAAVTYHSRARSGICQRQFD